MKYTIQEIEEIMSEAFQAGINHALDTKLLDEESYIRSKSMLFQPHRLDISSFCSFDIISKTNKNF